MQYLLTKEEYNTLHGEGDSEVEELEKELINLKAQIQTFKELSVYILYNKAEEMNREYIAFEIEADRVPELFEGIRRKY